MTGGNEPAIAAAGLTKRYGKTAALCDVSLQASAGTVTALLGPNGAGKTTMVPILTTQYLDEADALAGSVVFIDAGRVVAAGTPAELTARAGQAQLDLIAATGADVIRLTAALGGLAVVTDQARRAVRVAVQGTGLE
ncbi:MAG TPA: ATP-binding cassette domain-containing protein, partial [Streptosporangiaceae bacterium]|nr:ATP-binding cassette domain-containing protein [Streptosporangiaceae bacterium]